MSELEAHKPGNRVDGRILALAATHSPEEISQSLGGVISPNAVAARAQTLLKSKDWLSAAQEDQLVTIRMNNILVELESRFMDLDNALARLKILKEIGNRLDKRQAATETDLNTYSANVGRAMADAYDIAMSYMKGALRKDIDPKKWEEAKREALLHAQREISKREAVEE